MYCVSDAYTHTILPKLICNWMSSLKNILNLKLSKFEWAKRFHAIQFHVETRWRHVSGEAIYHQTFAFWLMVGYWRPEADRSSSNPNACWNVSAGRSPCGLWEKWMHVLWFCFAGSRLRRHMYAGRFGRAMNMSSSIIPEKQHSVAGWCWASGDKHSPSIEPLLNVHCKRCCDVSRMSRLRSLVLAVSVPYFDDFL